MATLRAACPTPGSFMMSEAAATLRRTVISVAGLLVLLMLVMQLGVRAMSISAWKLPPDVRAFYQTLCQPRCDVVFQALRNDGTAMLQSSRAASDERKRMGALPGCKSPPPFNSASASQVSLLYTILANPFAGERCCYPKHSSPRGRVPEGRTLDLHLDALSTLPSHISEAMILVPYDKKRRPIPGYLDIVQPAARLPFPAQLVLMPNNTLGSHGMYLHAYAMTRGSARSYDYYVFAEDDYVPLLPHFDALLRRMYVETFGADSAHGCLAGLVQGWPVEPHSRYNTHLESSHIMSTAALEHVFTYVFDVARWNGSTAGLMMRLAGDKSDRTFGKIQYGFGLLLREVYAPTRNLPWHVRSMRHGMRVVATA